MKTDSCYYREYLARNPFELMLAGVELARRFADCILGAISNPNGQF